jgi:UDP-N-acetylglucosamine 2-epimerase (non-hydrolysing)
MSMLEEIDWLCTHVLHDYLITTDYLADVNLLAKATPQKKMLLAGIVMIDTFSKHQKLAWVLGPVEQWG